MLEIKNTGTEMKNAFDGLISRVDTAKERISELEDISNRSLQIWKAKKTKTGKKKKKDRTEYQGLKDNYKSVIYL